MKTCPTLALIACENPAVGVAHGRPPRVLRFGRQSAAFALLLVVFVFLGPANVSCNAFEPPGSEEQGAVDKANKTLDGIYHQLISKGDSQEQTSLRDAQRAWIKWRDAEAMYIARHGGSIGGSALRVDYATAELKLINDRITILKGYLSQPPPN